MIGNNLIILLLTNCESTRCSVSSLALVGLGLILVSFFMIFVLKNASDPSPSAQSDSSAPSNSANGSGDDPWWKYVLKAIIAVVVTTSVIIALIYQLPGGSEWIDSFIDYSRRVLSSRPCESITRVPQLHSVVDVRSRAYLGPVGLVAYIYYILDWIIELCGGSPTFTGPQFKQLLGVFEPLSPVELEIMIRFEQAHESWQQVQPLLQCSREIGPDKFQHIFAVSPSPELATLINAMFESGEMLRLPQLARENVLTAYGVDWNFNFDILTPAQLADFDRMLFKVISQLTRSLDKCHSYEDLKRLCNSIVSALPDAYTMKVIMIWLHHMSLQPVVPFGPRVAVGFF